MNEIARSFRPVLEYLEIEFETDIPDDLPKLSLDPLKIRQVFLNILRNAQESINHPNGVIHFHAETTSQYVRISVCDNGCGMTSSQKARVFEPFITYKSGGTGLGLAVTREIIEAHHGFIEIESAPGTGSTFHVYIPLIQPTD